MNEYVLQLDAPTKAMIDELLTRVARAKPSNIMLRIKAVHIMDCMAALEKRTNG